MTIEELTECDAATLEKITDAELLEHFKQFLTVTRPELAKKPDKKNLFVPIFVPPQKRAAMAMLEQEGLDIGFLLATRRKKK